jgi:8-oxo-dGTP diphosphatase
MKPIFGNKISNMDYQVRKGAYAVIFNATCDKVLSVHNKGFHFLPGGGIENNENEKGCIEREMLEETGFQAEVGSFIGQAFFYFISSKDEYILSDGYFYRARLMEKLQNPIEIDHQMEWIHVKDMDKLFFYQHQVWAVKEALKSI